MSRSLVDTPDIMPVNALNVLERPCGGPPGPPNPPNGSSSSSSLPAYLRANSSSSLSSLPSSSSGGGGLFSEGLFEEASGSLLLPVVFLDRRLELGVLVGFSASQIVSPVK